MSTDDRSYDDTALDELLGSADAEVLRMLKAHLDPRAAHTITARHTGDVTPDMIRRPPAERTRAGAEIITFLQARAHARELARDLNSAFERALDLSSAFDFTSARELDRDLTRGLDRARDLTRDLARAADLDLDRARNLVRDLVRALDLDPTHDRVRAVALAHALALALPHARVLARTLDDISIDVSGADLSHLDLGRHLDVLDGVVWTSDTHWPPGIAHLVAIRSKEIRPGVYQVRGGSERDPVDLIGT